jgi:UDP-4-amino-4-deoxy-L-arabinose formyltransferase/UDP-glucuronic acid dehydrogenase (UDP-4-keto-hexauronic acid decarboxylating)
MRTFFLSATQGGLETARIFARHHPVAGYISLTDARDNSNVAGFASGRSFCAEAGIAHHEVGSYALDGADDRALFADLSIDALVVSGWQRLVPAAIIDACGVVLGVHGSPLGINRGRGRSPQNWALIKGYSVFDLSIFRIAPGVDDGEILASTEFHYNLRDDIHSSYLKTAYATASMLVSLVDQGGVFAAGRAQDESDARYLPARQPEDGAIDWHLPADQIVDQVRALTEPYPGAFTTVGGRRVAIWDAVAFRTSNGFPDAAPGALLHRYVDGELLVKCGTDAVIVRRHDLPVAEGRDDVGLKFDSVDSRQQMQRILDRHRAKYPQFPLAEDLLD